jgi:hypothetical protein
MAVDSHRIRALYPAFGDLVAYPPDMLDALIALALARLDPNRWGNLLDEGVSLFVAHRLSLGGPVGGSGGSASGAPVSSKSVGGVSIAYNWEAGAMDRGGGYNLTGYGREFLQLARMVGMGVVQL